MSTGPAVDLRRRALRPGRAGPRAASRGSCSTYERTDGVPDGVPAGRRSTTTPPCPAGAATPAPAPWFPTDDPRRRGRRPPAAASSGSASSSSPRAQWPTGHGPARCPPQGQDRPRRGHGSRAAPSPGSPTWGGASGCAASCCAEDAPRSPSLLRACVADPARLGLGGAARSPSRSMPSAADPQLVESVAQGLAEIGRLEWLGPTRPGRGRPDRRVRRQQRLPAGRGLGTPGGVRRPSARRSAGSRGRCCWSTTSRRSRWTLTVAAQELRRAGAPGVLPFALALDGLTPQRRTGAARRSVGASEAR